MNNISGGGFSKKPRALMCYICGREYGTASLQIHLKTCMKKWHIEEDKKPRKDRRPMPQPPKQLVNVMDMINGGGRVNWEELDAYNEKANDKWNEEALIRCEYCNRTFLPDRLTIHRKICSPDKPFKPLPPIKGGTSANSINSLNSVSTSASNNARGISNRTPSGRMATPAEQTKSQNNLKMGNLNAAVEKQRSSLNVKASYGQGQSQSSVLNNAGKSSQMMIGNSRANINQQKTAHVQGKIQGQRRVETRNINYLLSGHNMGAAEYEQLDLQPCDLCGRRFASDRIERHQKACLRFQKGDTKHARKVAQAERKRIENERFVAKEAKYKKNKWREQHRELVEGMRYGRKIKAVQQRGGDIRSLGPAPKVPGVEENLTECPYCYRRFNPQSAEKHINICRNVVNKPKPVPSKPSNSTASMRQTSYNPQQGSPVKPYLNSLRGNLKIKDERNVAKSYDLSSSYEPASSYGGNQRRLGSNNANSSYNSLAYQTCQGFRITGEPMKLTTLKGAGGLINESIEMKSSPKRVTKGGGFGMHSPPKKSQMSSQGSSVSDNITPIQSNVRNVNLPRRFY